MPFPVSSSEIAKTEAKTGFTFPPELKARFSKDNGGEVELVGESWQLIPFLDSSDRKRLTRTCNDIVRESASIRELSKFPTDAFVIAQNGGGDYLIILPSEKGSKVLGETVYFWDHETGEIEWAADSLSSR